MSVDLLVQDLAPANCKKPLILVSKKKEGTVYVSPHVNLSDGFCLWGLVGGVGSGVWGWWGGTGNFQVSNSND